MKKIRQRFDQLALKATQQIRLFRTALMKFADTNALQ